MQHAACRACAQAAIQCYRTMSSASNAALVGVMARVEHGEAGRMMSWAAFARGTWLFGVHRVIRRSPVCPLAWLTAACMPPRPRPGRPPPVLHDLDARPRRRRRWRHDLVHAVRMRVTKRQDPCPAAKRRPSAAPETAAGRHQLQALRRQAAPGTESLQTAPAAAEVHCHCQ